MVIIAYEHLFGNQRDAGGEPPRRRGSAAILRCRAGQQNQAGSVQPGKERNDCPGTGPLPRWASPVPGLSYSLFPGKHNEPRQRQYGRPATGPPLCKGSCRRTPTEGLAEYRRWQPVLPVRCPDGPSAWAVILSLPRRIQPAKAKRGMAAGPPRRCRARQLNESRLEFPGFTIPPAWLCHAVPPLHKGGCGEPPRRRASAPKLRCRAGE